jgi:hypothetical protein
LRSFFLKAGSHYVAQLASNLRASYFIFLSTGIAEITGVYHYAQLEIARIEDRGSCIEKILGWWHLKYYFFSYFVLKT